MAQEILRDVGCGAGDGCSINMTFLNQEGDRLFHNIEMAPATEEKMSQLNTLTASPGEHLIHCNSYVILYVFPCLFFNKYIWKVSKASHSRRTRPDEREQ